MSQDGSRLVIRFEAEALDAAALPSSPAPELIQGIRPGDAPATLVVDLGPRFGSFRSSELPAERGAARIVVDVLATATTPPPAGAPGAPGGTTPPAAASDAPPLLDLAPTGGVRTIVIDAGHGGEEEGAKGPGGTLEKSVTLSVARRLKAALEARLGVRVILTRDADQTVGLDDVVTAIERVESGHTRGKVVLRVDGSGHADARHARRADRPTVADVAAHDGVR